MVPTDHRICDQISFVPTPGHTPGHVSVWIQSGGEKAVITGDCMHHPCQIAHPDWVTAVDTDPGQGAATRQALLERLESGGGLLMGSHFAEPTAGRIQADRKGFRLLAGPRRGPTLAGATWMEESLRRPTCGSRPGGVSWWPALPWSPV